MFHWEPTGGYCCTKCMAIVPFWFSTETSLICNNALLALNWRYRQKNPHIVIASLSGHWTSQHAWLSEMVLWQMGKRDHWTQNELTVTCKSQFHMANSILFKTEWNYPNLTICSTVCQLTFSKLPSHSKIS